MADKAQTSFEKLYNIDVSGYIEKKNGLNYLSWANAIAEFKKVHPNMTFEVKKFENGLPYVYDENTGYMVFTSVTVDGLTLEMWLPVMDSANNAMNQSIWQLNTFMKTKAGVLTGCAKHSIFQELPIINGSTEKFHIRN